MPRRCVAQALPGRRCRAGGTKDMPPFICASDTAERDWFVATAVRWKEFEASLIATTTRLRKSIDAATG